MKYNTKLTYDEKLELKKNINLKNVMQVPEFKNIVVSITTKDLVNNKNLIKNLEEQISSITGQKPIKTFAKHSIANFKLRKNMPIGLKTTLRSKNMNDFFYKLNTIVFPRIRDFRGFNPKSFDGSGNYNIGIKEIISFPEIDYDKINKIYGLNISINTSAKNNKHALALFQYVSFPFYKKGGN